MSTSFRPKQSRACVMIAERDTKTIHCYIKGCASNVKGFSPKIASNETTTLHQILCSRIAPEQYKKQWSLS